MDSNSFWKSHKYFILRILGICGFFMIWHVVAGFCDPRYLPRPTVVAQSFVNKLAQQKPDGATLLTNIGVSFGETIYGFVLANLAGIPLGLCMAWYRPCNLLVRPLFELIRPIPPMGWIPLSIIWFGIGFKAKAFIIFLAAFFPIVLNSYTGIKMVKDVHLNFAKTCGASNWQLFTRVAIPAALPMVFTGVRISLGNAWTTLVAAEMLASTVGLGYMIMQGRQFARTDIIIVGMVTIAILGLIMNFGLARLENHILKWRVKQ